MHIQQQGTKRVVTIDPGEHYVTREPLTIKTLLGSCVSACLYDPVTRVIGMNHFLLANQRYTKTTPVLQSEAGRYGIHAMELLINSMIKQGANRLTLKAKVFGGGDVLHGHRDKNQDNFFVVGQVNSRFVIEFLNSEKIPIVSSDLGKDYGRVIFFRQSDQSVFMRKISHDKDPLLAAKEHKLWERDIKKHVQEEKQSNIQFW